MSGAFYFNIFFSRIKDGRIKRSNDQKVVLFFWRRRSVVDSQGAEQVNENLFLIYLEAPTGIEPVYKVLQTSA